MNQPETEPQEFRWEREMRRIESVSVTLNLVAQSLAYTMSRLEQTEARLRKTGPDSSETAVPPPPNDEGTPEGLQALMPQVIEVKPDPLEQEARLREAEFKARVEKLEKMSEEERMAEWENQEA